MKKYLRLFACFLVLLTPVQALAAFGRVTGQITSINPSGVFDTTLVFTFPSPVTSGNTVSGIATWDISGGATVTSVTDDKGNTYNISAQKTDTDDNQAALIFWLGNITNAPTTITISFSVSCGARGGLMREYSGVTASSDPSDGNTGQFQNNPGNAPNAVTSGNLTTTTNGDGIVGFTVASGGVSGAITAGTGFSIDLSVTDQFANEDLVQSTAGTIAATFTVATAGFEQITFVLALKTSGAPPPPTGSTLRSMTGVGK